MERFTQDLRYAVRSLRRSPGFAVVATLTLALGIGAVTALFSVVNAVLLRPLPYDDPDRLVMLWEENRAQGVERSAMAPQNLADWREQTRTLDDVAGFWPNTVTIRDAENEPVRAAAALVTVNLFPMLGVEAAIGRVFTEDEGRPGAPGAVLLSWGAWQDRFGGDPDIVGSTITMEESPMPVVGILPRTFDFPEGVELWYNVNFPLMDRYGKWMFALGRLAEGTSREAAALDLNGIASRLAEQFPQSNAGWGASIAHLHEVVVGDVRSALMVLLAATGAILLIACANVANLNLTQAESRHTEVAVRSALGAGRGRLVRQLLTESLLLAGAGALVGLVLAWAALRGLVAIGPGGLPRLEEIAIDFRVVGFAAVATVLTGFLFGLAPVLRLVRADLTDSLKEGTKGSAGRARVRVRNGFVMAQLALAVVLVIGAGLLLRSFVTLQQTDSGFNSDRVLTLQLNLAQRQYPSDTSVAQFYDEYLDRLAALPGVEQVGMASALPLSEALDYQSTFLIAEREPPGPGEQNRAYFRQVDPRLFQTLGIALQRGRHFTDDDDAEMPGVVIVNEAFVDRYFPGEDPLEERLTGTRQRFGPLGAMLFNEVEIVGVVADVKYDGLSADSSPSVYFPHPQAPFRLMNVVLRTRTDPLSAIGPARAELGDMDPSLAASRTETMEQIVDRSVAAERFSMLLAGLFGVLALALAAVGIYGVLSYTVEQRGKELGIRMALGADRPDVQRMVLGHGLLLTGAGLLAGVLGAFWLTRFLASQLYGISARDPITFVGVVGLLGGVALLASWVPVRRAVRVSPVTALRNE